mmetsp:Transcript_14110/g.20541  ORF Transcript_14110/g.20541 Transcript_14110/m.20541 type:complete len:464 (+) Transcript_14110:135-1526(+)
MLSKLSEQDAPHWKYALIAAVTFLAVHITINACFRALVACEKCEAKYGPHDEGRTVHEGSYSEWPYPRHYHREPSNIFGRFVRKIEKYVESHVERYFEPWTVYGLKGERLAVYFFAVFVLNLIRFPVLIFDVFVHIERPVHETAVVKNLSFWCSFTFSSMQASLVLLCLQLQIAYAAILPPYTLLLSIVAFGFVITSALVLTVFNQIRAYDKEFRMETEELSTTNNYQDLEKDDSTVFMIFFAQLLLFIFLGFAVQQYVEQLLIGVVDGKEVKLDAFAYLRYALGFIVSKIFFHTGNAGNDWGSEHFWFYVMSCSEVKVKGDEKIGDEEETQSHKDEKIVVYSKYSCFSRLVMDMIMNRLGIIFIIYTVPILYAQSEDLSNFAFNFGAAVAISTYDDVSEPKKYIATFEQYSRQGIIEDQEHENDDKSQTVPAKGSDYLKLYSGQGMYHEDGKDEEDDLSVTI